MYAIYLRKSRKDLELEKYGEGETLARHKRTLLEFSRQKGYEIGRIYEEIVSGETIAARPQMQALLSDVEKGSYEGVIVMELERLARGDSIDQGVVAQAFKLTDTLIITPSKTYDPTNEFDEEYFEFGLFMSRREYKTINRRLQTGRLASVKEGNFCGNKTPYGYDKVKLEGQKGFTLTPNADADTVRLIFHLFVNENMTIGRIANHLNDLGIKPQQVEHFARATIRDILRNPVYAGKIRWNWRQTKKSVVNGNVIRSRPRNPESKLIITEGKHPAIISGELYNEAQRKFGSAPTVPLSREVSNPFAHVIHCSECGKAVLKRRSSDGTIRLVCDNKYCSVSSAPYEVVEDIILETIRDDLGRIKLERDNPKPKIPDISRTQISKLEHELTQIKAQQDRLYDLLEQGVYTQEVFLERQEVLGDKRKKSLEALDRLRKIIPEEKDYDKLIYNVTTLLEEYPHLPPVERNNMIRECIKDIHYYREKSDRFHQNPVSVEIEYIF